MKKTTILIIILMFNFLASQEIKHNEIIKIGNFKYRIFLNYDYNYERNFDYINYIILFKGKEYFLGNLITFRRHNSSTLFEKKINSELPPDIRSKYKDGIILSEGSLKIDYENKNIIIIEKKFYEDEQVNFPDCIKKIYSQNKNGILKLTYHSEFYGNYEKIISK